MNQINETELENHMSKIAMYIESEEETLSKIEKSLNTLSDGYISDTSSLIEQDILQMKAIFKQIDDNRRLYIYLLTNTLIRYKNAMKETEKRFIEIIDYK